MRRALLIVIPLMIALFAMPAVSDSVRASGRHPAPTANLIRVDTVPAGLIVEVNGTPVQAPYSFACDSGTVATLNTFSPQTNGSTRYVFAHWTDGGNRSHEISCDTPANFTAFFSEEYEILVNTAPSGRVVLIEGTPFTAPAAVWCPAGFSRLVDARLQEENGVRYMPSNWSNGGSIAHRVTCNMPHALLLSFVVEYLLGLFSEPIPGLLILVDGGPLQTPAEFPCREGTEHVLQVPETQRDPFTDAEYRFVRWSDFGPATRAIRCNQTFNYTAIFERVGGTVPPGPSAISWPAILALLLVLVGLVVLLPVFLLRRSDRRRPPATAPLPMPGRAAPPPRGPPTCPRCGSPAAADWTYCMMCGTSLR
jgi:hypothetical protein